MIVKENDTIVLIEGNHFTYYLDKHTGLFSKLVYNDVDQIAKPVEINIWREPTYSDMYIKQEWYREQYDKSSARAYNTAVEKKDHTVVVQSGMALVADTVHRILDMETVWTVDAAGVIVLNIKVKRCQQLPVLPRFGIRLFLNQEMDKVTSYGIEPVECFGNQPQKNKRYSDSNSSYVAIESETCGIMATSENIFSFDVLADTQKELANPKNKFELNKSEGGVLCLDYVQEGAVPNSFGPGTLPQYRLEEKQFDFNIKLAPYTKGE